MAKGYTLVTGATSGIGEELVRQLVAAGEPVVACGRNESKLSALSHAGGVLSFAYDLRDTAQLEESLTAFLQEQGCLIKGFVHCAGVYPIASLRMLSDAAAHEVMDVNLFSAVAILRALVKKRVNHGALRHVVMVSSTSSMRGTQGMTAYCASKGAVESFVRAAATELAPQVRVNAVRPGAIPTPGGYAMSEGAQAMFDQPEEYGYLLGRGSTADVVSMVRYLLSEQARWITGQCFTVDGGLTAH